MKVKGGREGEGKKKRKIKMKETGGGKCMKRRNERKKTECNFNRFTSNLQGLPGDRGMRGEIGTFGFKVRNKMLYLLKSRYIV